jgi:hypothetical protein
MVRAFKAACCADSALTIASSIFRSLSRHPRSPRFAPAGLDHTLMISLFTKNPGREFSGALLGSLAQSLFLARVPIALDPHSFWFSMPCPIRQIRDASDIGTTNASPLILDLRLCRNNHRARHQPQSAAGGSMAAGPGDQGPQREPSWLSKKVSSRLARNLRGC